MAYEPSRLIRSMVLFTWDQTAYFVGEWVKALGLGLTGCKPFLLRPARLRLAASLARFEPLVRRILFIMAVGKSALVPPNPRPRDPASTPPCAPTQQHVRRHLRTPRFRTGHGKTPTRAAVNGPRIRVLDMPLVLPDPFDFPARKTDILPVRALIQRLRALQDVFENPAYSIKAMQRQLAEPAPSIRQQLPPGVKSRSLGAADRDTACQLHMEAAGLTLHLNSS
tara:strand:- start:1 stop:672 length:672 start_codon:yes stop_codon:yes gene_type:complete